MSAGQISERRAEARIAVCLDASWDDAVATSSSRITDQSAGGCYIDSISEAVVGQIASLGVLMPDKKWLRLKGAVTHQTPRLGFGVRFVGLSQEQQHMLRSLMRKKPA
jgi:hypothetical protein